MRLFTRLLSSSHRALVDPQPRVLNQFDRHRHKYTGRANLRPAFAIVAPEVEERKFWRRSVINDEKTNFSFFLSFFCTCRLANFSSSSQLLDLISYRGKNLMKFRRINPWHCRVDEGCQLKSPSISGVRLRIE